MYKQHSSKVLLSIVRSVVGEVHSRSNNNNNNNGHRTMTNNMQSQHQQMEHPLAYAPRQRQHGRMVQLVGSVGYASGYVVGQVEQVWTAMNQFVQEMCLDYYVE